MWMAAILSGSTLCAQEISEEEMLVPDTVIVTVDSISQQATPSTQSLEVQPLSGEPIQPITTFNPDPMKALWYSALCPGLGQIYNRRYWKLPIVVGGFMGLAYGMSWNNRYLEDYTMAYLDAMDSDPSTNSYLNFLPYGTREEDIDQEWLKDALKRKKDYFRRNRDLCIISMIGLYLLCMVDAYVDAQLFHFDISPGIAMDMAPTIFTPGGGLSSSGGLSLAIRF